MTGRKAIIIFCSWKLLSLSLECTWSYKNMELAHKSYFCIWYLYLFSLFLCNNIYENTYTRRVESGWCFLFFYMKRPSHGLNCVTEDSRDDIYIHAPIVLQNRHVQSFLLLLKHILCTEGFNFLLTLVLEFLRKTSIYCSAIFVQYSLITFLHFNSLVMLEIKINIIFSLFNDSSDK